MPRCVVTLQLICELGAELVDDEEEFEAASPEEQADLLRAALADNAGDWTSMVDEAEAERTVITVHVLPEA